jgi:hypothetical protein
VLGASAKLDGAFAVVVSLHGKTADALAISGALPTVTRDSAIMAVAHVLKSPAKSSMVVQAPVNGLQQLVTIL